MAISSKEQLTCLWARLKQLNAFESIILGRPVLLVQVLREAA